MAKFRGAFHLHTDYSYDSKISIQEMAEFLKEKGYSFALMSEHVYDRAKKRYLTEKEFRNFIEDCRRYSSKDFLMIPGLEFACCDNKVHLLATPLPRCFSLEGIDTAEKIFEKGRTENALVFLVHPFYGGAHARLTNEEFSQLDGFEVWNYNYQGASGPSADQYSKLLKWLSPEKSRAVAGLDLHRKEDFGDIYFELELDRLSEEDIFQKIRMGEYSLHAVQRTFDSKGNITNLFSHLLRRTGTRFSERLKRLISAGK